MTQLFIYHPRWRQFYYCSDTNNKCIATNVLANLIFQDHSNQNSGLFQDQKPISALLQDWNLVFHFSDFAGSHGADSCGTKESCMGSRSPTGRGNFMGFCQIQTSAQVDPITKLGVQCSPMPNNFQYLILGENSPEETNVFRRRNKRVNYIFMNCKMSTWLDFSVNTGEHICADFSFFFLGQRTNSLLPSSLEVGPLKTSRESGGAL